MADAIIVTDAYPLGHPKVKGLAQTSPLNVQSGLSKVLHEGLSCAAMGPHPEKGEGIYGGFLKPTPPKSVWQDSVVVGHVQLQVLGLLSSNRNCTHHNR